MEAVIETHHLVSRFWLQGADGEAFQLRIADCGLRKRPIGNAGIQWGNFSHGWVLRTVTIRNEHGKRRGLSWCSAGSYGRSIIRRGEFHDSTFLPICV